MAAEALGPLDARRGRTQVVNLDQMDWRLARDPEQAINPMAGDWSDWHSWKQDMMDDLTREALAVLEERIAKNILMVGEAKDGVVDDAEARAPDVELCLYRTQTCPRCVEGLSRRAVLGARRDE